MAGRTIRPNDERGLELLAAIAHIPFNPVERLLREELDEAIRLTEEYWRDEAST
jgi:hypothetical protein